MPQEFTEKHVQLIEDTHDKVSEIVTVLKGYDGKQGLCKQVERNTRQIWYLWIALAIITGGGSLSVLELIKLVR